VWVGIADHLADARTVAFAFGAGERKYAWRPQRFTRSPAFNRLNAPKVHVTKPKYTYAVVSLSFGTTALNGLAVDDSKFDTAGPPPACGSTTSPDERMLQPPSPLLGHGNDGVIQAPVRTQS
jgi:hypothetical protein